MEQDLAPLAILFADVSGSTRLYELLGDARAQKFIGLCLGVLGKTAGEHDGRTIKTIGDELMCAFPSATHAMRAAIEMQTRVAGLSPVGGHRLGIRVGFQSGPVVEENGDVFGDCVNVASRVVDLAKSGQILTTQEAVGTLSPQDRFFARSLHSLNVKGRQQEVAVCEIVWQQDEEMTMVAKRTGASASVAPSGLRLTYNGRELRVGMNRAPLRLGRDRGNDLVIGDRMASREHARIEWLGNNFVLTDLSSNGTYLSFEGQPEIKLQRQQVVLHGQGLISFGHPYGGNDDVGGEVVRFLAG